MPQVEVERDREVVRVYEWRLQWLRHGGFNKRNANRLAGSEVNYKYAIKVLNDCKDKGYDEEFVMRLLT